MQHYLDLARPYLDQYGYWAIFGVVIVESFGIPAPGQAIIMAGALLASQGDFHIAPLLLTAWLAAVIGDNIGYGIGRFGGKRLVLRYGHYIGIREDHLARVEHFFDRFGGGIVITARFVDLLRQLNGVIAGLSGMQWWRFFAFNALGAALWVGVWGMGVYYLGHHMEGALILFKRFEPYLIGTVLAAIAALLFYLYRHKSDQKNPP